MRAGFLAEQQPTFSTTSESSCVISTDRSCACTSNYSPESCSSGNRASTSYGNEEECILTLSFPAVVTATAFDTEAGFDKLKAGGVEYDGTSGPTGVLADQPVVWSSDSTEVRAGFRICASPAPSPSAPAAPPLPNALSPTVSSTGACVVSRSGACVCTSNYSPESCEIGSTGRSDQYGNSESCIISLSSAGTIQVLHFDTEAGYC